MLYSGVVSVTFRSLKPAEIVKLAGQAGLAGIEWGGDVHVPHGDVKIAREVYKMTIDSGLKIPSYGSYYELGISRANGLEFERVLESAVELHVPQIRIWAGNVGSRDASADYRKSINEETQQVCDAALKEGIKISFEFHNDSLTDTPESTIKLIRDVNRGNLYTYWQAALNTSPEERLEGLKQISPWLSNIHVYQLDGYDRLELSEGEEEWKKYFDYAAKIDGDRFCMLEFVKNELPGQLLKDAQVLNRLLKASRP